MSDSEALVPPRPRSRRSLEGVQRRLAREHDPIRPSSIEEIRLLIASGMVRWRAKRRAAPHGYGIFEYLRLSGDVGLFDYLKAKLIVLGDSGAIEGQILVRTEDDRWVVLRDADAGSCAIELGPEDAFWWWQSGAKLATDQRAPNTQEKVQVRPLTPFTDHERLPDGWLKPATGGSARLIGWWQGSAGVGPGPRAETAPRAGAAAAAHENERQGEAPAEIPDLVTLDQAAAAVHRKKRTLERYKTKGELPDPTVEGGGGRPAFWVWKTIRPWLETRFEMKLPETYPANRRHA